MQRQSLWTDLYEIAQQMSSAWCIIGDFNFVLYKVDIQGGNEVADHELEDLSCFTEMCEIHEINWSGSYYSWTNKTIINRIDRAFCNIYWWDTFDFTHNKYLANAFSDHDPQLLLFPTSTKPKTSFQYYDMLSKHKDLWPIINSGTTINGNFSSL